MRFAIVTALAALIGASATAHAADHLAEPGLWELSVKMTMPGMPMAMPERTYKQCYTREEIAKAENMIVTKNMNDEHCKIVDVKRKGDVVDYDLACKGDATDMKVKGHMVFDSTTAYHSTMHMKGTAEGRPMEMNQEVHAKRIGECSK